MDNQGRIDHIAFEHLKKKVDELGEFYKELNSKVIEMDKKNAVDTERFDNFNKTLSKIEDGISTITNKIEIIEKKPLGTMDKIYAAVIGGVITFIVTKFLTNILGGWLC